MLTYSRKSRLASSSSSPFTCTFCWRLITHEGPPHTLGRAASRLACRSCHAALLDLAVCWVCGELVVRADECVSLGWCFWHRACYGCLLCGSRKIVVAKDENSGAGVGPPAVEDVFRDEEEDGTSDDGRRGESHSESGSGRELENVRIVDHDQGHRKSGAGRGENSSSREEGSRNDRDNGNGRGKGKGGARREGGSEDSFTGGVKRGRQGRERLGLVGGGRRKEILDVPLCATCVAELEDEMGGPLDDEAVVQRALDRIDRSDAGLSRERWERMNPIKDPITGSAAISSSSHHHPHSLHYSTQAYHSPARFQSDGAQSGSSSSVDGNPNPEDVRGIHDDNGSSDGRDKNEDAAAPPPSNSDPPPPPPPTTIYVSMRDPVNGPAFKPSSAKPIPRWMQLLWNRPPPPESPRQQQQQQQQPDFSKSPQHEPQLQPKPSPRSRQQPLLLNPALFPVPERTSSKSPAVVTMVTAPGLRAVRAARSTPSLGTV
ncbi:hypothetical protein SLS62_004571 [Diatrype stigma]|uniref:LIM zinc-binding domain-containing protein n=1 Tax=Diatrype stigma TaxID=117547 RepID=A0AAN9UU69_9PEZI